MGAVVSVWVQERNPLLGRGPDHGLADLVGSGGVVFPRQESAAAAGCPGIRLERD